MADELNENELDMVNGGAASECAGDSRFLNSLAGLTDRYGTFKMMFGTSRIAEIARGWAQVGVIFLFQIVAELGLETLEVAKYIVIDDGYQTVEFQDGVLERRRCEEDFLAVREGLFGLIDDGEVPLGMADVWRFGLGKLKGADDDFVGVEGVEVAGFDGCVETLGLQDD